VAQRINSVKAAKREYSIYWQNITKMNFIFFKAKLSGRDKPPIRVLLSCHRLLFPKERNSFSVISKNLKGFYLCLSMTA